MAGRSRTRVSLNHREIQAYLDGKHGVSSMLREKAAAVLSAAEGYAPVDTGAYKGSLHLDEEHTDRMVVRVVADDEKAMIIEANYGVLSRALDGADGKVDYTRKDGKTIRVTAAQAANYGGANR